MSQILRKEDKGKIASGNDSKKIKGLSDLVLVHKTDYIPIDGVIKSSKDAGVLGDASIWINDQEYIVDVPSERESVHFSLNGEVTSHTLGDWDESKYAIIIPFEKIDKDNIVGGITVDTYTKGSVQIPQGSYILCPQTEIERIESLTKNLNVVGYEGENVTGYANMFLSKVLGYKKEKIGEHSWEEGTFGQIGEDGLAVSTIFEGLGWSQNPHSYSDESDIANAKMKIHEFAGILKLIKENNLIVDEQSYKDVYQALQRGFSGNFLGGASPCTLIPYNNSLWEQFFSEIADAMGEELPEEIKERFNLLRNTGCEKDKEAERRNGHKQTIGGSESFLTILGEVSKYCLEPYQEKYLSPFMEEYISQYQDLMQEFSQLSPEERDNALKKLASSLNKDFFASNKISQTFFEKLEEQGLLTEDDKTAISVIMQQGDIRTIKSEDMRKFIEAHGEGITDIALVSRVLSKKMEDSVLYSKKIAELTDEEKQTLKYKIRDLSVKSKNGYTIYVPYERFNMSNFEMEEALGEGTPYVIAYTSEAEELLRGRLGDLTYFRVDTESSYDTDFTHIQDTETIGQYLSRMETCTKLIHRQISGEDIKFNPDGTQQQERETTQDIQTLSARESLGISEINSVTTEMRRDLTLTRQQQTEIEQ